MGAIYGVPTCILSLLTSVEYPNIPFELCTDEGARRCAKTFGSIDMESSVGDCSVAIAWRGETDIV